MARIQLPPSSVKRTSEQNTIYHVAAHVLVWTVVAHIPLLTLPHQAAVTFTEYLKTLVFPLFYMIVFYVNYFFLVPRQLLSKKIMSFCFVNIMLYGICASGMHLTHLAMGPAPFREKRMDANNPKHEPPGLPIGIFVRSIVAFALTTGAAVAVHTTSQWFRSEELRKDLEREHLKSELANLKNQLNPHFFFNTLNNIYSLIAQDQHRAGDAVLQLSKLMRYLLYESNERFVLLAREVDFIHHYIDLMKLRLAPNVVVRHNFTQKISGYMIAPLLFITLIENSFKHGVSAHLHSEIDMTLDVIEHKQLRFMIRNTSYHKSATDRSGSGIGLENLRKRLTLLYPNKHALIINKEGNFYETILTVEL